MVPSTHWTTGARFTNATFIRVHNIINELWWEWPSWLITHYLSSSVREARKIQAFLFSTAHNCWLSSVHNCGCHSHWNSFNLLVKYKNFMYSPHIIYIYILSMTNKRFCAILSLAGWFGCRWYWDNEKMCHNQETGNAATVSICHRRSLSQLHNAKSLPNSVCWKA